MQVRMGIIMLLIGRMRGSVYFKACETTRASLSFIEKRPGKRDFDMARDSKRLESQEGALSSGYKPCARTFPDPLHQAEWQALLDLQRDLEVLRGPARDDFSSDLPPSHSGRPPKT